MRNKSDVSILFPQFKSLVENYFQLPLISVYSDNGGEYLSLKSVFQACGISHFTTPPHTPELNGTAERRNRHITETGLALLHQASLPLSYWSYAFQTAVYLINRMSTPIFTINLLIRFYSRNPRIIISSAHLIVFVIHGFVHTTPLNFNQSQSRVFFWGTLNHSQPTNVMIISQIDCIFLGMSHLWKIYFLFRLHISRILISFPALRCLL